MALISRIDHMMKEYDFQLCSVSLQYVDEDACLLIIKDWDEKRNKKKMGLVIERISQSSDLEVIKVKNGIKLIFK